MSLQWPAALAIVASTVALAAVPAGGQQDRINQARRLDLAGKQDAAIALFGEVLQETPDSFDAQYGIARALDLAGRYEEARQHFAKAIELAPEETKDQTLRMMGVSYAFSGDAAEAAKYFQQVFDRRIASANFAGAAEVANELGRVLLELGDPDNAFMWYQSAYGTAARRTDRLPAEVDLDAFRWAHAQARIAARKGNAAEARHQEAIAKSLLDKGTNPDQQIQFRYLLGYDAFHLKDYAGAIEALRKADQDDPFIQVLLAQAYDQTGQARSARGYYQKALLSSSHAVNNAFARPVARRNLEAPR